MSEAYYYYCCVWIIKSLNIVLYTTCRLSTQCGSTSGYLQPILVNQIILYGSAFENTPILYGSESVNCTNLCELISCCRLPEPDVIFIGLCQIIYCLQIWREHLIMTISVLFAILTRSTCEMRHTFTNPRVSVRVKNMSNTFKSMCRCLQRTV